MREAQLNRTRKTLTATGSTLTASMLRDIERNAPIEADHIVGDLLRRGHCYVRAPQYCLHPPEGLRGPPSAHTPTGVVGRIRSTNLEGAPSYSRILRIGWVMETVNGPKVDTTTAEVIRGYPEERPWNPTLQKTAQAELGRGTLETRYAFESGNSRIRFPLAAKIALQTAGANGGTPGSPTPAGGASLSTMWTFVL